MIGITRDLRTAVIGHEPARPVRPPRRLPAAIGLLLIIGLGAITTTYFKDDRGYEVILAGPLGLLSVAPLLLLWHSPLWAWRVTFIALLVGCSNHATGTWPWDPVLVLVTLLVLFVVALREPVGVILWVGLSVVILVWLFVDPTQTVGITVLIAVILVFGEQIQRRRRAQRDLKVQAQRSEQLTERARIARELHDVVAHSMSLVAVRAETAPYRLAEVPEPVREEFLALAATARETLTELRRLLGVLRTDTTAALAPQPTLSDLDDLVEAVRAAGMDVRLTSVPVPPAMGLTIYRIVQEALSNAARHAPGAPVRVTVERVGEELHLSIHNGPSVKPAKVADEGHGLLGMRERVELLEGTFQSGPTPDGGFVVTAKLPWSERD